MTKDARSLVEEFLLTVRSGMAPERAGEFMASSVLAHQVVSEGSLTVTRTPADYHQHVLEMKQAFGEFVFELQEVIADGNKVFARWRQDGTHFGDVNGYPSTGKPIVQLTSCVYRVEAGRIVEYWIQIDRMGIELQLQRDAS